MPVTNTLFNGVVSSVSPNGTAPSIDQHLAQDNGYKRESIKSNTSSPGTTTTNTTSSSVKSPYNSIIPIETGFSLPKDSSKRPKQIQKSIEGFEPIPKKSAIIKTDKPRPHICSTCTRAFARLEHLKRHERSHTNEKPFQCAACGRCFARRDLVLRHQQKLHSGLSTDEAKDIKKGENTNIITNYGNKEGSLPTKNGEGSDDNDKPHSGAKVENSAKKRGRKRLGSDTSNTQNSGLLTNSISPQGSASIPLSTIDSYNEHSTLFKHVDNYKLRSNSTSSGSNIKFKSSASPNLQPKIKEEHPPFKRHRHNSFSATSALSYTRDNLVTSSTAHELPEAPHQVGFATPQLSAQELNSKALMSGIDLNALGLEYEIDEFNLDHGYDYLTPSEKSGNPSTTNLRAHGLKSYRTTRTNTPLPAALTPGGSNIADWPQLSEYLAAGYNGGGAGFTVKNDKFNLFTIDNSNHSTPNGTGTPASGTNTNSNNGTAVNAGTNNTETSNSIHNDKSSPEDWLEEFINTPFESNFATSSKYINTIGFVPSISPPSSTNSQHATPSQHQQHITESPLNAFSINPPYQQQVQKSVQQEQQQYTPQPQQPLSSLQHPRPQAPTQPSLSKLSSDQSVRNTSNSDIPSLFRSRQIDLFHKEVENNKYTLTLFTRELRDEILKLNNLVDSQFPTLDELNQYVGLFKNEFDKYFPFIHLATLRPSIDNYPLLLSIASVGALYAFHSSHAMLMFNITRYRIHKYLEQEKKSFKTNINSIPIWVYQSMVLLIFIGIFNNDLSVTKTMTIFLNSLIELVKLTSLNLPLENFLTPPPILDNIQNSSDLVQEQNFSYFILAQTRIRTCHTILLISNLFTSLIGLDCSLHSIDLKCGIHCKWEELWECSNHNEWVQFLQKHNYVIDSKFSLVELANGNESYTNCLNYLTLNNYVLNDDEHLNKKFQMKTLLSLLMSIHEKIYLERSMIKNEPNGVIAATKWRMNSRPIIESLIKSWESLYIKNGGVFYLNEASLSMIYNQTPITRLILPLLSFAKIRKCISLTPIVEKIWKKDWKGMNEKLEKLRDDPEALKDSANYALDIVKLWIDYVSIHKDAEKTSIRTPVFFITCIFSSLLVIAEFLLSVEKWAQDYDHEKPIYLNAIERTLWLRSEMIFKKIENCLVLNDKDTTYSEFLRLEAKGALDVKILEDDDAKRAVNPNTNINETITVIQDARLSSRGLYLGVRILADAPIWPIALLFAQALKARAIHISKVTSPV